MKKIVFFLFINLCALSLFGHDSDSYARKKNENLDEIQTETSEELSANEPSNFAFYFGPELLISNTGVQNSQSLGVSTNIGIEYEYTPIRYLSFIPSFDISIFHYNFSGKTDTGIAYISAIENRTALSLAILLDFPLMARFDIKSWFISVGGGLAFLIRGAFLEPGVKADDLNADEVSAKKEVKLINSYFWKKGRYFYPSLGFKIGYAFDSGWKVGFKFKSFVPIFNVWDSSAKKFSDSLILQMSIVLHPAKK